MNDISDDYLKGLNAEFSSMGMEHRKRPWEALRRYSSDKGVPVGLSSSAANKIFAWFDVHSKPGVHLIGCLFESVYFYDGEFWKLSIPVSYGRVSLNALDSIIDMPESTQEQMMADNTAAWKYAIFWADCLDYAHGLEDISKDQKLHKFGKELLFAGSQELKSAIQLLGQSSPESRAILNSRMAVEIFIKSFIALKAGLDKKEAKKIGHNLSAGLEEFIKVSGFSHLKDIEDEFSIFPDIHERYSKQSLSRESLWKGFSIAQSFGTLVAREFTGRNTLEQVFSQP